MQYVFTMNGVSKVVAGGRYILKDIYLSFFPGAMMRRRFFQVACNHLPFGFLCALVFLRRSISQPPFFQQ